MLRLARSCQEESWYRKAAKRALPGPGGGIFPSRGGWFLRYPEIWEKLQLKSFTMKEILVEPEGTVCWSSPKNFRAGAGFGPTQQMCSARLLPFLISCSSGSSFLLPALSHLWAISKLSEHKKKTSSFLSGQLCPLQQGEPNTVCRQGGTAGTGRWVLGRTTDSDTAKFSSYTHCLLQLSVVKRGDSGPAALNGPGLGKVLTISLGRWQAGKLGWGCCQCGSSSV